jgi:LmbE family N-acetylglucosaminyl deacetylase
MKLRKPQMLFICLMLSLLICAAGAIATMVAAVLTIAGALAGHSLAVVSAFAAVSLAISLSAFCWLRITSYREYVKYDVRADYEYDIDNSGAFCHAVRLTSDGFNWPDVHGTWDTGFLRVRVRSTISGRLFDPKIEIRSKHVLARQYFERGAFGIRYFGISPIVKDGPAPRQKVLLTGQHLAWDEQEATLMLFQNRSIEQVRTLIVAPHPDDAEIAAFGLYSTSDAFIITITTGGEGGFRYQSFTCDEDAAPRIRAMVRTWDSINIPSLGGVDASRSINLGYLDGTFAAMYAAPDEPVRNAASPLFLGTRRTVPNGILRNPDPQPRWSDLVRDLRDILDYFRPEIIVTPHPVLDGHLDHGFTTTAVLQAMQSAGLSSPAVYLYVIHLATNELYPHGPSDGMISLPPTSELTHMDTIYSHLLGEWQRQMKYFALEGMHDLRSPPVFEAVSVWQAVRSFISMLYARVTGLGPDPNTYFRRALRPNELFFVSSSHRLSDIVSEFLKRPQP